jgi:hypothetical protein
MVTAFSERITAAFFRNPVAWVLLILLLIALYGSYQRGRELDQVCEAIPTISHVPPRDYLEKAANICIDRRNSN